MSAAAPPDSWGAAIRLPILAAALVLGSASAAAAQSEAAARAAPAPSTAGNVSAPSPLEAWQAPVLTSTRYDEHWDALAHPELRDAHWTNQFKYVPLPDGAYLTTGLELRARNENYRGNGWGGASAPDDSYLWLRALPYADAHAGSGLFGVRAFVQPMATYAVGVEPNPSALDQSRLDLLQGFVDVRLGPASTGSVTDYGVTVRYGRQMISLGDERLVGTRYGINSPLAYDGLRALVSAPGAVLTVLDVSPVTPGPFNFDDRSTHGRSLWGVYATVPKLFGHGLDLYYLGYRNAYAVYGGVRGQELRHTLGVRLFASRADDWHYDLEAMAQFGSFAGSSIGTWAAGLEVGHRLWAAPLAPDLTLRADVASGDRRRGDGRLGTFDPLFPKGKYFGELSPVGPANIINLNPRLTLPITAKVSLGVMAEGFWRYALEDGIYAVPGSLARAAGESKARFVGSQGEGVISWQATQELNLSTSVSVFNPGAFIKETGPHRTIELVGAEANFRF